MNQDTLVAAARSLFDAFNTRDFTRWERILAPQFVADYPCAPGLDARGARAYNAPFVDAFSDLHFKVERVVVQGSTVVLDATASGTFDGPLASPQGTIPPNGKKGSVRIVLLAEVENGRLVREQTVWNQLDLFQQLGILPGPSA